MRTPVWSARAQADLARIAARYGPLDSDFVLRSLRQALVAAQFLGEFPQVGALTRRRGLRKWRVKTTPFLLLYRTSGREIRITRVAHDAQDWHRW